MPWKLFTGPGGFIETWLIGTSSMMGSVGGIMLADYWFVRRTKLNMQALYCDPGDRTGEYYFNKGFHLRAFLVALCAIVPILPGFVLKFMHGSKKDGLASE